MNIKDFLKEYKKDIDSEMESLLKNLDKDSYPSQRLLNSVKYSALAGGKRLRPSLSLMVAEAILGSDKHIAIKNNPAGALALAIELTHCGSLIHDDMPCMDDDDLRRGQASNHKEFDEATALLAGDFLICYPIQVLLEKSNLELTEQNQGNQEWLEEVADMSYLLSEAAAKLTAAINKMIFGQALDMDLGENRVKASIDELICMEKHKTGALLVAAAEISALLSGAKPELVQSISNYATKLGLAFQITDDVLDQSASTEELGKTCGKDAEQNKFTFVKCYGLEEAKEIAANLIKEAKEELAKLAINTDKLELLADYVISRNY